MIAILAHGYFVKNTDCIECNRIHHTTYEDASNIKVTYTSSNSPPELSTFEIKDEDGANPGWDLDNDDVWISWVFEDGDSEEVNLYFTYSVEGAPSFPDPRDYYAAVEGAEGEVAGYDLNWEMTDKWDDYRGSVWVMCVAFDGEDYSDVLSYNLTSGIDGTDPATTIMDYSGGEDGPNLISVSYTHLRAHET